MNVAICARCRKGSLALFMPALAWVSASLGKSHERPRSSENVMVMRKEVNAVVTGSREWFRNAQRMRPLESWKREGLSMFVVEEGALVTVPRVDQVRLLLVLVVVDVMEV